MINLRAVLFKLLNNSFIKDSSTLVIGTAVSQLITIVGMIFLARLYSPSDFGLLASITAISGICVPFLSLRYDMSILIERTRSMAAIAYISIFYIMTIVTLFLICIGSIGLQFNFFKSPFYIGTFICLVIGGSLMKISENIYNRDNRYIIMTTIPIIGNIVFIASSILLHTEKNGLLWGVIIGQITLIILVLFTTASLLIYGFKIFSLKRMTTFLQKNIEFPRFNLPASLLNNVAANLPVLAIQFIFGSAAAGYYALLNRILLAPTRLISLAINRVFIQRIASRINNYQEILPLTRKVTIYISCLSIIMGSILLIISLLNGFSLLLGEQWIKLNDYALIFIPAVMLIFVSKSISRFAAYRKNKIGFYYQLAFTITMAASLGFVYIVTTSFIFTLISISLVLSFFSLLQLVLIFQITYFTDKNIPLKKRRL